MASAKIITERTFFPYVPYLDSARHFCAEFQRKGYVSWYDLLASVTLLSLSVEALANTAGELHIVDFKDFESASPKAKIRMICQAAAINYDKNKSPFVDVLALLKVRNQLAHPKLQKLRYESSDMPLDAAQKHYEEQGALLHDIEKALTPEFALRSLESVRSLEHLLIGSLDPTKRMQGSTKNLVINEDGSG